MNHMNREPLAASTGPAWDSIGEQVHCPLCYYNLYGLSEPRCPECGYSFEWAEMLDPARRLHPYLFEHHPEKNFRSFWRTAAGALRPRRFWRELHPVQPSRPKRLMLYWVLTAVLSYLFAQAGMAAILPIEFKRQCAWYGSSMPKTWLLIQISLVMTSPVFLVPDSLLRPDYMHLTKLDPVVLRFMGPLVLWGWPWLTFAILMIFRWSMGLANVRPGHVRRCVVYCCGTYMWIGLVVGLGVSVALTCLRFGAFSPEIVQWGFCGLMVMLFLVVPYQLAIAYRRYLRFSHPVATVAVSQVIALLVVSTIWYAVVLPLVIW